MRGEHPRQRTGLRVDRGCDVDQAQGLPLAVRNVPRQQPGGVHVAHERVPAAFHEVIPVGNVRAGQDALLVVRTRPSGPMSATRE